MLLKVQPVLLPDSDTKQRCELICMYLKTCLVFLLKLISNLFGDMFGEFDNNDYILEKMHSNSIEYIRGFVPFFTFLGKKISTLLCFIFSPDYKLVRSFTKYAFKE